MSRPTEGVFRYLVSYLKSVEDLYEKKVVDVPAGKGRACRILKELGADVLALDIFPEFMDVPGVNSEYGDMKEKLPVETGTVDMVVCQEGIEHVSDQLHVFQEFNRILKINGELIITTPNISNFIGRLTYLVNEGELLRSMPPSELDSIWFTNQSSNIYYGHYFLVGIQRLRNIAILSGFSLSKVVRTGISRSSIVLAPIIYPIIIGLSVRALLRCYFKYKGRKNTRKILHEQFMLNISPTVLFSKHLFLVCKKERGIDANNVYLKSLTRS